MRKLLLAAALALAALAAVPQPTLASYCGYCDFIPGGAYWGCKWARMPFVCMGGLGGCQMLPFEGCAKGKMLTQEDVNAWSALPPTVYNGVAALDTIKAILDAGGEVVEADLEPFKFTISDGYPWSTFFTFSNQLEALQWMEAEGLITDPELSEFLRNAE